MRTGGWPTRSALAGKFVIELIPGTVEKSNPLDTLWTDREYATHLRDLGAPGRLRDAAAFPAVLGAAAGDPRSGTPTRPSAPGSSCSTVTPGRTPAGPIDTAWYPSATGISS